MQSVTPLPMAMSTLSAIVDQTMRALSSLMAGIPCSVKISTTQLKITAFFGSSGVAGLLTASNAASAASGADGFSGGLLSSVAMRSLLDLLFGETVHRRCRDVEN